MVDETQTRPRACAECAKAKAKCSLDSASAETSICDRCSRLSKKCAPQIFQPRKRRRPTKIAPVDQTRSSSAAEDIISVGVLQDGNTTNQPDSSVASIPTSQEDAEPSAGSDYKTVSGRGQLIAYYKRNMESNFPFVILPETTPASNIELEKPFTCKTAILAAVNKDVDAALDLEDEILHDIAERVFVQGERNIDLLQGLLILIGFYHYHTRISKQVVTLTQLAVSVLADLGLNRLDPQRSNFEVELRNGKLHPPAYGAKNHEERRAFCGCYYLASIVSGFFHRSEPMKDAPSLEWYCSVLETQPEYQSDQYAVHLVRLQQLRQRITSSILGDRFDGQINFNEATVAAISSFRSALAECKRSAPVYITNQASLRMHYLALELLFSEAALAATINSSTSNACVSAQCMNLLTSGLYTIRSFTDIWISMPPASVYDLPCATQFEGAMVIIMLYKISNLVCPGWDAQEARNIIEIATLIGELQACFERARHAAGVTDERHVFCRTIKPLIKFKNKAERGLDDGSDPVAPEVMGSLDFANIELDTMLGFELGSWDLLQSI